MNNFLTVCTQFHTVPGRRPLWVDSTARITAAAGPVDGATEQLGSTIGFFHALRRVELNAFLNGTIEHSL